MDLRFLDINTKFREKKKKKIINKVILFSNMLILMQEFTFSSIFKTYVIIKAVASAASAVTWL